MDSPSTALVDPSTTPPTSLYTSLPFLGVANPRWGKQNLEKKSFTRAYTQ